jgi:predicted dehydrogenase
VTISVALVGYGLIGQQRHDALRELRAEGLPVAVIGYFDPFASASDVDVPRFDSMDAVVAARPDLVVVAVPHDVAVGVTTSLLEAGLDVLMEKPMGRGLEEADALAAADAASSGRLHVGMNYRFFAGIRHCLDDARSGRFGQLVSCRMMLGHGGSPGDELTWKLDPVRAGGGCLIDPGIHLLDLALVLGDDAEVRRADAWSGFWGTGIEEECHLVLSSSAVPMMSLDVSVIRWRSYFAIEISGTDGYGIVTGRGRSYGPQIYRRGDRWGWRSGASQADSEMEVCRTDGSESFRDELRSLLTETGDSTTTCDATQARCAMALLDDARSMLVLHTSTASR